MLFESAGVRIPWLRCFWVILSGYTRSGPRVSRRNRP